MVIDLHWFDFHICCEVGLNRGCFAHYILRLAQDPFYICNLFRRWRQEDRDPCVCWFNPRCLQQPGLHWAKANSPEVNLSLPGRNQPTKYLAILLLLLQRAGADSCKGEQEEPGPRPAALMQATASLLHWRSSPLVLSPGLTAVQSIHWGLELWFPLILFLLTHIANMKEGIDNIYLLSSLRPQSSYNFWKVILQEKSFLYSISPSFSVY